MITSQPELFIHTPSCSRPIPGSICHVSGVGIKAAVQAFHRECVHQEAGYSSISGIRISQRGISHHIT